MYEAAGSPLTSWANFYVIIGGAAAALTGLMFVVITLIVGMQRRVSSSSSSIAAFGTPNVVHFGAALLTSAIIAAPWPALWLPALLLGLLGLGGLAYLVIVLRRFRRQTTYQPVLEDWLFHTVIPFVAYAAFFIAAILLLFLPVPFLFVIAASTVLLLFVGIHNAWDTVTYLALDYSPTDEPVEEK
jgi:hypothetical protein